MGTCGPSTGSKSSAVKGSATWFEGSGSRKVPSRVPSERQRKPTCGVLGSSMKGLGKAMPKSSECAVPRGRGDEEQGPGQNSASRRVSLPLPSVTHSSRPELGSLAVKSTLPLKLHRESGREPTG